ncbi:nphp3, partial [Symbiodinium microadriaticum]
AEAVLREVLEGYEQQLGPVHPRTLFAVDAWAKLLQAKGDLEEEKHRGTWNGRVFRHCMELGIDHDQETRLGASHPATLAYTDDFGALLHRNGDLLEAEELLKKSFRGREELLGPAHPDTLVSLRHVSSLLKDLGELMEADPWMYGAAKKWYVNQGKVFQLEYASQKLGLIRHPWTLHALIDLGHLLHKPRGPFSPALFALHCGCSVAIPKLKPSKKRGKVFKAGERLRQALTGLEDQMGVMHPDTIGTVTFLARIAQEQGRLTEAEDFFRRALQAGEDQFGSSHPATLSAALDRLWDLSTFLRSIGKLVKALSITTGLATKLLGQGNMERAEELCRSAIRRCEEQLGAAHPSCLSLVAHLALLLQIQENWMEAESLHRQALRGREKVLGPSHLDTLISCSRLGNRVWLLYDLGKDMTYVCHVGDEGLQGNLGYVIQLQGKLQEAQQGWDILNTRSLEPLNRGFTPGREKQLGPVHIDTMSTVQELAALLQAQGRTGEAEMMQRRAAQNVDRELNPKIFDYVLSFEFRRNNGAAEAPGRDQNKLEEAFGCISSLAKLLQDESAIPKRNYLGAYGYPVKANRYREKWSAVKGIAEANDLIHQHGGFGEPWQPVPPVVAEVWSFSETGPSAESERSSLPRFPRTEVCCANVDTLTAALLLGDASALSFANADIPGGRYRSGGLAQEEDLCRLLPQLYPALKATPYPIPPGTVLVARDLLALRKPGTYAPCPSLGSVTVLTAAMPCGAADRRPKGGWAKSPWAADVSLRIRSVLHAARQSGHANLVLGAFGCGAFGNPARPTAAIFREELASPAFRGAFGQVVFAIIDPIGTGNLKPFREEIAQIAERPTRTPLDEDSESHALSELGPADTVRDAEDAEAGAELTDEALAAGLPAEGSDFSEEGHLATAERLLRRDQSEASQKLGGMHPAVMSSSMQLAEILCAQGRPEDARELFKQVLSGREVHLGPTHPDTLATVTRLGILLVDQVELPEAEALLKRALEGYKIQEPPDPASWRDVAARIVALQKANGKYVDAEELCRKVLESKEKDLGKGRLETLRTVEELAGILRLQGRLPEAEQLSRRCLQGCEQLGAVDAETTERVTQLGLLLQEQGQLEEAEELQRRALKERQKQLCESHPLTLACCSRLASVLQAQAKLSEASQTALGLEEAEDLGRRALLGGEKEFGQVHPETLTYVNTLAKVLQAQNKVDEAETLQERMMQDSTLTSLSQLGSLLHERGKLSEAETLHRRVLRERRKLDPNHTETLNSACALASVLRDQGDMAESEDLYREALEGYEKLDRFSANIATTATTLASLLDSQGKHEEAEDLLRQVLEGREETLGESHLQTLRTVQHLARHLRAQKRRSEAEGHRCWEAHVCT